MTETEWFVEQARRTIEDDEKHAEWRRRIAGTATEAEVCLVEIEDQVEQLQVSYQELLGLVAAARMAGVSWRAISDAVGMSRQAAQKRFGREPRGCLWKASTENQ